MLGKMLVFAILLLPITAKADLVYKCADSQVVANLRVNENGRGGRLEMDDWQAYPPTPLLYTELDTPSEQKEGQRFLGQEPSREGFEASLSLPTAFLTLDFFPAKVVVWNKTTARRYLLQCHRF